MIQARKQIPMMTSLSRRKLALVQGLRSTALLIGRRVSRFQKAWSRGSEVTKLVESLQAVRVRVPGREANFNTEPERHQRSLLQTGESAMRTLSQRKALREKIMSDGVASGEISMETQKYILKRIPAPSLALPSVSTPGNSPHGTVSTARTLSSVSTPGNSPHHTLSTARTTRYSLRSVRNGHGT